MGGARYRANCLPGPREPFKRDTVDLAPGATEGAGFLVSRSLTLSSAHVHSVGGGLFDDFSRCPEVENQWLFNVCVLRRLLKVGNPLINMCYRHYRKVIIGRPNCYRIKR